MRFNTLKQTNVFIVFCIFFLSCTNKQQTTFKLKEGDLLFQNTGNGKIDNAIKNVTATNLAKNYSHVGIATQEGKEWYIVEAIPKKGVCKTPLLDFLNRNKNEVDKSKTTVARLDDYYNPYISRAIAYGLEKINQPYDAVFLWNDDAYYCSELVYKMFASQPELPKEKMPFLTHLMTFKDSSGKTMSNWVTYYKKIKTSIPEGIKGTNPNLMASSPHIKFVHDYEKE